VALSLTRYRGTWRPALEDLAPEDFKRLVEDVGAENHRRGFRLEEGLRAQLDDHEARLLATFRDKRMTTEREHDYQMAEALAVAWAERAAVLAKDGEAEVAWWLDVAQRLRALEPDGPPDVSLGPLKVRVHFRDGRVWRVDADTAESIASSTLQKERAPVARSPHDDFIDDWTR
jgi:hypothetical protein